MQRNKNLSINPCILLIIIIKDLIKKSHEVVHGIILVIIKIN